MGEKGFAVFLEREGQELGPILIRFKDGKAVVVGMPPMPTSSSSAAG